MLRVRSRAGPRRAASRLGERVATRAREGIVKVREIMSAPVTTLERTDSLAFAEELMNVEGVHHLPVVEGDVLIGVLSHRDILAASISTLSNPSEEDDLEIKRKVEIARVMHGIVETIDPDADALRAADALLAHNIGCLPVVDERFHVVGIVTGTDFVRMARELLADGRAPGRAAGLTKPTRPATAAESAAARARPAAAKRTASTSKTKGPRAKRTAPATRARTKTTTPRRSR
jgi:CBS domain-containing membrane protein